LYGKVLANDAIERIIDCDLDISQLGLGSTYIFRRILVPILSLDDAGLVKLSTDGQLSLSLEEMKAIQAHFQSLQRDPTDVELETIAQTWSEHCSHKTLKGIIEVVPQHPEALSPEGSGEKRRYENLLKETIFGATQEIRRLLGKDD